jgi:secretion/DNA translocation related TadE-like protein
MNRSNPRPGHLGRRAAHLGRRVAPFGPSFDRTGAARVRAGVERGAATVLALALSAVVIVAGLVTADLGALAAARAQAQTAADLAALAAVTPTGESMAVDRAREAAIANGADLTRCACAPMEAVIGVRRRVLLPPFGVPVELHAYARAVLPGPGGPP